jgi:hypothetical protein
MQRKFETGLALVVSCALGGAAQAQCDEPFTVDLFSSFLASGEPLPGELQVTGGGWRFREPDVFNTFLSGVEVPGATAWGDPTQGFYVPLAGPVSSPDPLLNRLAFTDRPVSMNAVFLHPGYGARDLYVEFVPTAAMTLLGAEFKGEVVGNVSNGVNVSLVAVRAGGADVTLIPSAFIGYTSSGHTTLTAGSLPLAFSGPNDAVRLVIRNNNEPSEDWLCGQLTLTMRGGPVIFSQPRNAGACQSTPTVLKVAAAGSGTLAYAWEFAPGNSGVYQPLADGVTAGGSTISGSATESLEIVHAGPSDAGHYRARIASACNEVVSAAATVTICVSDYDCSGFVDTDDFTSFVLDFEAGIEKADVDGTGFVDTDDFTFFVLAFESGC